MKIGVIGSASISDAVAQKLAELHIEEIELISLEDIIEAKKAGINIVVVGDTINNMLPVRSNDLSLRIPDAIQYEPPSIPKCKGHERSYKYHP